MNLKEAKAVRDLVKSYGLWCIVPLGHGPNGYFARIGGSTGYIDFHNPADARKHLAGYVRKIRRRLKERREEQAKKYYPPRSPIEMMIDRACGL